MTKKIANPKKSVERELNELSELELDKVSGGYTASDDLWELKTKAGIKTIGGGTAKTV